MIWTALSHPNSPRQRDRAVANLLERPRFRARIARGLRRDCRRTREHAFGRADAATRDRPDWVSTHKIGLDSKNALFNTKDIAINSRRSA
jgi:hypothetical protein